MAGLRRNALALGSAIDIALLAHAKEDSHRPYSHRSRQEGIQDLRSRTGQPGPERAPETRVQALGVGQRGIKTDVRDARCLSEAPMRMDLGSVHVPSRQSVSQQLVTASSGLPSNVELAR